MLTDGSLERVAQDRCVLNIVSFLFISLGSLERMTYVDKRVASCLLLVGRKRFRILRLTVAVGLGFRQGFVTTDQSLAWVSGCFSCSYLLLGPVLRTGPVWKLFKRLIELAVSPRSLAKAL